MAELVCVVSMQMYTTFGAIFYYSLMQDSYGSVWLEILYAFGELSDGFNEI